MIRDLPKP